MSSLNWAWKILLLFVHFSFHFLQYSRVAFFSILFSFSHSPPAPFSLFPFTIGSCDSVDWKTYFFLSFVLGKISFLILLKGVFVSCHSFVQLYAIKRGLWTKTNDVNVFEMMVFLQQPYHKYGYLCFLFISISSSIYCGRTLFLPPALSFSISRRSFENSRSRHYYSPNVIYA